MNKIATLFHPKIYGGTMLLTLNSSNKLKLVLAQDSAARRENPKAVAEIEKRIFGVSGKYTLHLLHNRLETP